MSLCIELEWLASFWITIVKQISSVRGQVFRG